jgi:hypothetical protein
MTSHTITNIRKANGLELTKHVTKNGKKKFIIKAILEWDSLRSLSTLNTILNPFNNRRLPTSHPQWKFRNLKEAEEHMTLAILKGWKK